MENKIAKKKPTHKVIVQTMRIFFKFVIIRTAKKIIKVVVVIFVEIKTNITNLKLLSSFVTILLLLAVNTFHTANIDNVKQPTHTKEEQVYIYQKEVPKYTVNSEDKAPIWNGKFSTHFSLRHSLYSNSPNGQTVYDRYRENRYRNVQLLTYPIQGQAYLSPNRNQTLSEQVFPKKNRVSSAVRKIAQGVKYVARKANLYELKYRRMKNIIASANIQYHTETSPVQKKNNLLQSDYCSVGLNLLNSHFEFHYGTKLATQADWAKLEFGIAINVQPYTGPYYLRNKGMSFAYQIRGVFLNKAVVQVRPYTVESGGVRGQRWNYYIGIAT